MQFLSFLGSHPEILTHVSVARLTMSGMSQTLVLSKNIGHPRKIHWLIIPCSLFQTRHNWVIWNILSIFRPTHTNIVYSIHMIHPMILPLKDIFTYPIQIPKKIPFNHMFSLKTNAHFVQDSSSKVFASEWKKCSRSPAEKIRHPQGITDGGADASSYNSQIKAGYNRNMVYRIAVLVLSVF